MVAEEFTYILPPEMTSRLSSLITLFQALGGLAIAYIIFNAARVFWMKRRTNETSEIRKVLERIDKKLTSIDKKISKK